ncbi:MAG TPA: DUF4291 domain-containing protein [Pirellulales bacterium]|jgi:hypothetical protein
MTLTFKLYAEQLSTWPSAGKHILAQYDDDSVVVYQAYQPSIGGFAIEHGHFGGADFSFSRMTWIKTNFLWMMYRSDWGTRPGQEITLALRLRRSFFDGLLRAAIPSTWDQTMHAERSEWQAAVRDSETRLQWDPDHDPWGVSLARRAIQLGLRGETMKAFAREELLEITDLTAFVAEQRQWRDDLSKLTTPAESVYYPEDKSIGARLQLDSRRG